MIHFPKIAIGNFPYDCKIITRALFAAAAHEA
jgi:hypothetical protein